MDEREEEESARPRPRVVDKRVSARAPRDKAQEPPAGGAGPTRRDTRPDTPVVPAEEAGGDVWTPDREARAREVAQQISATPSLEWVVNVAVTLANVAGTKLDLGDPADARLAIDALAALLDKVGTDLGEAEKPLRQTLAQLQMAFAQGGSPPPAP